MKAVKRTGAPAPTSLHATTPQGQREPIKRMVLCPAAFGAWAIVVHFDRPGHGHKLMESHHLPHLIRTVERYKAEHPSIEIGTKHLQPDGIRGYEIHDVWMGSCWAAGVRRSPIEFRNAQDLYMHLRSGYYPDGACWVKEEEERRTRLYRSHWMAESMTAWEIAEHRMEHPGAEIHPDLEVPAGTCPRCLSRYVVIPDHGVGYHCLECDYDLTY